MCVHNSYNYDTHIYVSLSYTTLIVIMTLIKISVLNRNKINFKNNENFGYSVLSTTVKINQSSWKDKSLSSDLKSVFDLYTAIIIRL